MYYLIDDEDRMKVQRIVKRLYTQQRMSADEMRDMAHVLGGVLDTLIPEVPPGSEP